MGEWATLSIFPKEFPTRQKSGGTTTWPSLCVPAGFDRFFAACAEEFKKGEPELPLLVKLAAEYGIEFQTGPPAWGNC
jgi:hypothetical protein